MKTLITDVKLIETRRATANLLSASEKLRGQGTENDTALATIKTANASGIEVTPANRALFIQIVQILEAKAAINKKRASFKNELSKLKSEILDATYEKEVQDEIDLLK